MPPPYRRFLDRYLAGHRLEALAELLPRPDLSLDDLADASPLGRAAVEHADALIHGGAAALFQTSARLYPLAAPDYPAAAAVLELDHAFAQLAAGDLSAAQAAGFDLRHNGLAHPALAFVVAERAGRPLAAETAAWLPGRAAAGDRPALAGALTISRRRTELQRARPALFAAWGLAGDGLLPRAAGLFPHAYRPTAAEEAAFRRAVTAAAAAAAAPLLLLEPWELDWEGLLAPLAGRPACLLFADAATLFQCLHLPGLWQAIQDDAHALWLPGLYPNDQFAAQPATPLLAAAGTIGTPLPLTPCPALNAHAAGLAAALATLLAQPAALRGDTPVGTALHRLGRKALFERGVLRLGPSRLLAWEARLGQEQWHDRHKGEAAPEIDPGRPSPDWRGALLDRLRPIAPRRPMPAAGRRRLAHVVPQVVDGGHAPSRLLRALVEHADRGRYDLYLYATELLAKGRTLYPPLTRTSDPTATRGAGTLARFRALGVSCDVTPSLGSYEETAGELARKLAAAAIDVAIFHGPDEINSVTARLAEVPLRVLFDHCALPDHPGFDLIVASNRQAAERLRDRYAAMGCAIEANPFVFDARAEWQPEPYRRADIGLPDGVRVLTTISNHLDSRLGEEMCRAVGEILQRVANAVYVPLGTVHDPAALLARFAALGMAGVTERVAFAGCVADPGQVARSFDLYLNEFPFGSGLAVLEAMAAGCPVVTMYDPAGPPQARYAAEYFGIERAIRSGRREEYVDLACRLLEDDALYAEWSRHAVARYEERSDPAAYVRRMEAMIERRLAGGG